MSQFSLSFAFVLTSSRISAWLYLSYSASRSALDSSTAFSSTVLWPYVDLSPFWFFCLESFWTDIPSDMMPPTCLVNCLRRTGVSGSLWNSFRVSGSFRLSARLCILVSASDLGGFISDSVTFLWWNTFCESVDDCCLTLRPPFIAS